MFINQQATEERMKVTIINPNIVSQKGDFFGTGIPYMPFIPAALAGYLRQKYQVQVIDAFGEAPLKRWHEDGFVVQGLTDREVVGRIDKGTALICLFAGHVVEHRRIISLLHSLKALSIPICIIENAQAVTAYSLRSAYKEFLDNGADFLTIGDPEFRVEQILHHLHDKDFGSVDGIIYRQDGKTQMNAKNGEITNLDSLPF